MSFVLPSDPDYRRAKQIRRGSAEIDAAYGGFLEEFRQRYGLSPLNVELDAVDGPDHRGKTPRLGIVLERTAEYTRFVNGPFTFDQAKQRDIAALFVRAVQADQLPTMFGLPQRIPGARMGAAEIFVLFEDFEKVAEWEVHDLTAESEIKSFEAGLGLGDRFWCTSRFSGPPIVFVHTDEQADELRRSDLPTTWADAYFELAGPHDEFGYLRREDITIYVDSKENFDTDYGSNWYHYFK